MTQTSLLVILHVVSVALLVGGTAAILVMRSASRAFEGDQQLGSWLLLRAVGLRVQLLGLIGAFASGLFLMFWAPPEPGSHWMEAKIALAILAGVCAHLDSFQNVRAMRARAAHAEAAPRPTRWYTVATFVLVLAAIVLVVMKPV